MKKFLFVFLMLMGLVTFDDGIAEAEGAMPRLASDAEDVIGPSKTTLNLSITTGTYVTITSTPGYRNCITSLDVSPITTAVLASYQMNVLTAGTTIYSVAASTGSSISRTWPETMPLCGERSQALYITGLTLAPIATNQVVNVSYQGFSQKK